MAGCEARVQVRESIETMVCDDGRLKDGSKKQITGQTVSNKLTADVYIVFRNKMSYLPRPYTLLLLRVNARQGQQPQSTLNSNPSRNRNYNIMNI